MKEKLGFEDVKQRAIARARDGGVADPSELERIGNQAKHDKIEKIGSASEKRYKRYILQYKTVRIREGDPYEDVYDGIDFWESYRDNLKLPDLPVQVKSGKGDVDEFRHDPRYLARNGVMLVFNVGPSVSQEDFDEQHRAEIARVRKIFEEHNIHFV